MVNWTTEKDLTLLLGILEFNNVTTSGKTLEYLAQKIGEGCTAKAVSHRLANMKKQAKASAEAAGFEGSPATPDTTPAAKATPKRSRGGKKKSDDNVQDDDESPTKTKGKRGRKAAKVDEEDEDGVAAKKIKIEAGIDEAEGLQGGEEEAESGADLV
ncbi:hypothetical protein BDV96DRAFT_646799 [Lophiotrema nucula]|uniref:Uncharacterized protein n=1 Tax=Lophiotrema nucula TaxID=690887 RepID=A0A6A5Z799_9PLEO|nr:hypothetical protein BDV96DRAFT_646799 [Lophiotrema nucula]